MTNDQECSVVIASSDGYSDAWGAFFTLFFRYWPECPFPVYLVSSTKTYPDERVETITSDYGDKNWGKRLESALKSIPGDIFIYLQEDYFLTGKVDEGRIKSLIENFRSLNAAYIKLHPSPAPRNIVEKELRLGELEKGSGYSVSLQATIWDKQTFLNFLTNDITPWKFEFEGSTNTPQLSGRLLSVMKNESPLPYYATAIKRGRWYYDAVKLCEKEGINLDLSIRPVEAYSEYLRRKLFETPYVGDYLSRIYRRCRFRR